MCYTMFTVDSEVTLKDMGSTESTRNSYDNHWKMKHDKCENILWNILWMYVAGTTHSFDI